MRRSRMLAGLVVVVGGSLGVVVACSDRPGDVSRVVRPSAEVRSSSDAGVEAQGAMRARGGSEGAKERLHRANRLDWIGVAHNAALREFGARLARGEVRGNVCEEIFAMVARASFVPATAGVNRRALRGEAERVLSASGACAAGAAIRPVSFAQSDGELSATASALVGEIWTAAGVSPTSADLAVALLPVVERANQLSPQEADIVLAGASVAQSSMEHWEATLTDSYVSAEEDGLLASYGGCFAGYGTADAGVTACMGIQRAPLVQPTTGPGAAAAAPGVRLVASYYGCPKPNHNEVVKQDVQGAIGGAIGAAWTGAGILAGALAGGVGMSSAEMMWQLGVGAWCYGSAAFKGTRIVPT